MARVAMSLLQPRGCDAFAHASVDVNIDRRDAIASELTDMSLTALDWPRAPNQQSLELANSIRLVAGRSVACPPS